MDLFQFSNRLVKMKDFEHASTHCEMTKVVWPILVVRLVLQGIVYNLCIFR